MKPELCHEAATLIGNPHIFINVVSRRVRQLTSGGGAGSRPLISDTVGLGAADIAMVELLEGKMTYELHEDNPLIEATEKPKRKKR